MLGLQTIFGHKYSYQIVLHLVIVVLGAEVLFLASQNRKLKDRASPTSTRALSTGDTLRLAGLQSLGSEEFTNLSDHKLVFVFGTTCSYCKSTIPAWNKITSLALEQRITVIGISLDPMKKTSEFMKEHDLKFPVYVLQEPGKFKEANHIIGVPETILVSSDAIISDVWFGLLSDDKTKEVVVAISEINHNRSISKESKL